MKNITAVILTGVVSLIVGYYLYPFLNETHPEQDLSTKRVNDSVCSQPEAKKQSSKPQESIQSHKLNDESAELASSEISEPEKLLEDSSQQQADYNSQQNNIADSEQLAGLQEWSRNHKVNLRELLINNLPVERAERLMELIDSDNPFLNEVMVIQDASSDEEWSYKIMEIINNFIIQHPNSIDVEVMSLTCKQLTCELLLREISEGAWIDIFASLTGYLLANQYTDHNQETKQFLYSYGEEVFYYQQFVFQNN